MPVRELEGGRLEELIEDSRFAQVEIWFETERIRDEVEAAADREYNEEVEVDIDVYNSILKDENEGEDVS